MIFPVYHHSAKILQVIFSDLYRLLEYLQLAPSHNHSDHLSTLTSEALTEPVTQNFLRFFGLPVKNQLSANNRHVLQQ